MSKDKDKKAERAESGKDAEILRLKAEIASFAEIKDAAEKYAEALRTEVSTVRAALATAEALIAKQNELIIHLKKSEAELGTARARITELEVSLSKIAEAVKVQAEIECREPPDEIQQFIQDHE